MHKTISNHSRKPCAHTLKSANRSSMTAAWGWAPINIVIWCSKGLIQPVNCYQSNCQRGRVGITHRPRRTMCWKGQSSKPLKTVNICRHQFGHMSKKKGYFMDSLLSPLSTNTEGLMCHFKTRTTRKQYSSLWIKTCSEILNKNLTVINNKVQKRSAC